MMDVAREMIFVVGVGRSGTSLVQSMLASHRDLAFGPETSIFRRLVASGVLARLIREVPPGSVERELDSDAGFRRTGLDSKRVVDWAKGRGGVTAGALYRSMLRCIAEDSGKQHVGDKDPRAVEWIGLLPWVADNAKVVHVVRDPRDVVASKMRAAWSKEGFFIKHLFANRVQIKIAKVEGPRFFESRYHIVAYEDILTNAEETLAKLCRVLSIHYDPQMKDFSPASASLVSEEEYSWKKETFEPLKSSNQGKWKKRLTPYQIALTEKICRVVFDQFEYERSEAESHLSLLEHFKVEIWSAIVCVADPIYRLYRGWRVRRARKFV